MIQSRKQLIEYIRTMLGEPTITVEVNDAQISAIIDTTIQMFTEYAPHACEDTIVLGIHGKGDYQLPNRITHILKCSKGRTGSIANFAANYGTDLVPDIWSEQFFTDNFLGAMMPTVIAINNLKATLDKLFGDDINYHFDPYKKYLRVLDDYQGPVLIHYYYLYVPNDEHDLIFDQEWVKKYCIAKTKQLWGSILGKYSATLVGGTQINASEIRSDAESELSELKEELLNKWADPAPIVID